MDVDNCITAFLSGRLADDKLEVSEDNEKSAVVASVATIPGHSGWIEESTQLTFHNLKLID